MHGLYHTIFLLNNTLGEKIKIDKAYSFYNIKLGMGLNNISINLKENI